MADAKPISVEQSLNDFIDFRCDNCGYSLRGLTADSRCPECGLAISETTARIAARRIDADWVRRQRLGFSAVLLCYVLGLATMVLEASFGVAVYHELDFNLLQLAAVVPLLVGVWMICKPGDFLGRRLPWIVRLSWIIVVLKVAFDLQPKAYKLLFETSDTSTLAGKSFVAFHELEFGGSDLAAFAAFAAMLIGLCVGWIGLLAIQRRVLIAIGSSRLALGLSALTILWGSVLVATSANYIQIRAALFLTESMSPIFDRFNPIYLGLFTLSSIGVFAVTLAGTIALYRYRLPTRSTTEPRPC
jgi:hypothetical protein